jgi:hypothetical protein
MALDSYDHTHVIAGLVPAISIDGHGASIVGIAGTSLDKPGNDGSTEVDRAQATPICLF